MDDFFIWNGISSKDMGLKVKSFPPISISSAVYEDIDIEDRDGNLTEFKKYEATVKTVEADFIGTEAMAYEVSKWLRGTGTVTFGNMENVYYKARINNVVPLEQILANKIYELTINFKCQPLPYLIDGNRWMNIKNNSILNNFGNYKSLPKIKVIGAGTLTINNINYIIKDSIEIDCEMEEVLDGKGDKFECDEFPFLKAGKNIISYTSGITKLEIKPNWRIL
ncbi:Phage tail protein [Clostridium neonatale]|uniref:phage tail protein n=1 Tax=Clostridium neonatale TaxID=137838 RepID=UPI00291B3BBB|nr:phage tail protein [Clostridium neonatale]CAI3674897.1 Phage tail protein [Clostridium neonatale]